MQETAVVGSQKLTGYVRLLEVARQKHQKVAKLDKWFIHPPGPSTYHGYNTNETKDFNKLFAITGDHNNQDL